MMFKQIKKLFVRYAPARVYRFVLRDSIRCMVDSIQSLNIQTHDSVNIDGTEFRSITLSDGPELIGFLPNENEKRLLGRLAVEKGLPVECTKILIDAIARFTYPHYATPYIGFTQPDSQKNFFHRQHRSLIQEDSTLSLELREKIGNIFRPKSGWEILDIGAFLGHGSLALSRDVGQSGRIISVEANQNNFRILNEHVERNRVDNIIPVHAAIWHTADQRISFSSSKRQANAIDAKVIGDGVVAADVPTTSIEALSKQLGRVPNLVTLTVNGAEVEAIEGLHDMAHEELPERIVAPGWYEKEGQPRSIAIEKSLQDLGYETFVSQGNLVIAWQPSKI